MELKRHARAKQTAEGGGTMSFAGWMGRPTVDDDTGWMFYVSVLEVDVLCGAYSSVGVFFCRGGLFT